MKIFRGELLVYHRLNKVIYYFSDKNITFRFAEYITKKALALQVLFFIEICFLNDLQYEEFEVVGFICGHKRRMVGRLGLEFDLPYDSATFSCGILKHFLEIG